MIRHKWDISPAEAIALQRSLAGKVLVEQLSGSVETVAGVDCAFEGSGPPWVSSGRRIIAACVLCDAGTMEVLATSHVVQACRWPYVPGLLSFRESPAVVAAVRKLRRRPDLLICDGQGQAHPRGLGLACHVGLLLDCPTIGVAKSRLCGRHRQVGLRRGSRTQLRHEGRIVGAVVRTRSNVKPLYVSVGHRVTLGDAVAWTLRCCRGFRLPEPSRLAHQAVTALKHESRSTSRSSQ